MTDDDLGTPAHPIHLEPLQAFGSDLERRDALWEWAVPACPRVQVT